MRLITSRPHVLQLLNNARERMKPLLCPNAETPDEMEGVMLGAQRRAQMTQTPCAVGIGVTATYPDHPQLGRLALGAGMGELAATAETWLLWLRGYADRPGVFEGVEVVPFLDHGWAPHEPDLALMHEAWFQEAMGIIMFDASAFDPVENLRRTAAYVDAASGRVVIEACPDKVYERHQIEAQQLRSADLLSQPEAVQRFVQLSGVDLIVPNLGTEHRAAGGQLDYRGDISREISRRVGPIQALHGTSSVGERLGRVGADGICKVNYYSGMARAATDGVRDAWARASGPGPHSLALACGSFWHRTRREAIAANIQSMLALLESDPSQVR